MSQNKNKTLTDLTEGDRAELHPPIHSESVKEAAGPGAMMIKAVRHLSQRSETGVDPKDLWTCIDH